MTTHSDVAVYRGYRYFAPYLWVGIATISSQITTKKTNFAMIYTPIAHRSLHPFTYARGNRSDNRGEFRVMKVSKGNGNRIPSRAGFIQKQKSFICTTVHQHHTIPNYPFDFKTQTRQNIAHTRSGSRSRWQLDIQWCIWHSHRGCSWGQKSYYWIDVENARVHG